MNPKHPHGPPMTRGNMRALARCGEADPFGPALPLIPLFAHIRQLGAQYSVNLFQVRNLCL
jgi:hypothetical protein